MTFSCGKIGPRIGHFEQRLAREIMDLALAGDAGERRIEIALVIHREDRPAVLDDPLAVDDAEVEKRLREELREVVAEPIPAPMVPAQRSDPSGRPF